MLRCSQKMQDSVNVKARLKKGGTYIWNLGWLVRMSKLWSCLGSYTPGRGCWWAKVGFPRVRSSFFCRHPEMVWVPEVWRRTRFCTWHRRRWWWNRWWGARDLEIISGTRVIVSRLDCSDQLAKLAKRRLRHFLGNFFVFWEPGKRRWGSRRWLWCCWWGSCERCCCCWWRLGERSLRRRWRWRWRWWCWWRSWWRCRWGSPLDRTGVLQSMLSTRPGCPLGSSTWNEGEVSCKFWSWEWSSILWAHIIRRCVTGYFFLSFAF